MLLGHLLYSGLFSNPFISILPNPLFLLSKIRIHFCFISAGGLIKKYDVKKALVTDASRESLLVYWLQLVIIFGAFWGGKSFADSIGKTISALEAIGATILSIILMIIAAKFWGWLKKTNPKYASIGIKVFLAVLLLVFIIS